VRLYCWPQSVTTSIVKPNSLPIKKNCPRVLRGWWVYCSVQYKDDGYLRSIRVNTHVDPQHKNAKSTNYNSRNPHQFIIWGRIGRQLLPVQTIGIFQAFYGWLDVHEETSDILNKEKKMSEKKPIFSCLVFRHLLIDKRRQRPWRTLRQLLVSFPLHVQEWG